MRHFRKLFDLSLLLVCALALFVSACGDTYTYVDVGGPTVVGGDYGVVGSATPTPGPNSGVCPKVTFVNVGLHADGETRSITLPVGGTAVIDATPKGADRSARNPTCDLNEGIKWTPVGACTLTNDSTFTPTVHANAAGRCLIYATVAGVTSNEFTVTVQ